MRPQDMDAHGRVALHDTLIDEITHVPVAMAQETLQRNPDGRFKILAKDGADSALADKKDADAKKRGKVLAAEAAARKMEEHGGAMADTTDMVSGEHGSPAAQPQADAALTVAERDADPDKEVAAIRAEAEALGIKLDGRIKDPAKLREALAAEKAKTTT